MSEPKDLTELSESEIVALTLAQGIRVERCEWAPIGYTGNIDAPFNECTAGNPVYSTLPRTLSEPVFTLEGTNVVVGNYAPFCAGVESVFITPDGTAALTSWGTFWAWPSEPHNGDDLSSLFGQSADDWCRRKNHRAQTEILPQLLTNIYRAVFAPDTVPAHWKAKGGTQP